MRFALLDEARELLEKANSDLEPELLTADAAREALAVYAGIKKLASYGETVLARKIDDATEVARMTGTSIGKAKETVETANRLRDTEEVSTALQTGEISFEQASEISKTEQSRPGFAAELIDTAKAEPFHVLRDKSRRFRLEAEQTRDLGSRQREARSARSFTDELGMVDIHLHLQPHVGVPIVNRAEAEAARRYRQATRENRAESFECHLADAYAEMLSGSSVKGPARRPELVVLVSHEVAKRGWNDVREGEICKIPGIGPVSPQVAKDIAQDAFLTGVLYDGNDLRNIRRWTRNIPVEVRLALELGEPPDFDGVKCVDCGRRFRIENDHVEPHVAGGPASRKNLKPRCWPCHEIKTEGDRKAGKLKHEEKRGPPRDTNGGASRSGPAIRRRSRTTAVDPR
jgi:hypothetical protein